MTGQSPLLYRHWPGGDCAPGLLARCRRGSRRALTDGGRSCRTRGPAFGARPRLPAVPAQVGAGAAAIGHHLFSRQADSAHPAGLGAGLSCPVLDRPRLVSYGPLARKSLGTRGAGSGDGHRCGGGPEPRAPSPGSQLGQPFAGLGCASVVWPVGRHVQALFRPLAGTWLAPCVCPPSRVPPLQGDGLTRPQFSSSHGPEATSRPDRFSDECPPFFCHCSVHVDNARFPFVHRDVNGVPAAS